MLRSNPSEHGFHSLTVTDSYSNIGGVSWMQGVLEGAMKEYYKALEFENLSRPTL
jgi:hypothetical protein